MRYLIFLLLLALIIFLGQSCVFGQDLDGICRITWQQDSETREWCGVAISDTQVLSCGHHGVTGPVRLEFCVGKHGESTRVSVPGVVYRSDVARDLSLIRYEAPTWAKVKVYRVGRLQGRAAVRGFLRGSCAVREGLPGRQGGKVDGFEVVELRVACEQGLSGSPLVEDQTVGGILIGSGGGVSHLVDPGTIERWVE